MEYEVIWTEDAFASLEKAMAYVRERNETAATRAQQNIANRAAQLGAVPLIGRTLSRSQPDIREVISGKYRIIYRVDADNETVEILKIWHSSRQEPTV